MPESATHRTRSPVPRAAASTRRSTRRTAGERSHIARPRPTSSSESAQRRSRARRWARTCRTSAEAPRWSGCPVKRRSSAPVATSHVSQGGATARRRGASATSAARRPRRCRARPATAGRVSAWAMRITRQSRGPASAPITLRERPRPGTAKRSRATARPAAAKAAATRSCARRSAADAAGRGPASASERAKRTPDRRRAPPRGRGRRGRRRRAPRKPTAAPVGAAARRLRAPRQSGVAISTSVPNGSRT